MKTTRHSVDLSPEDDRVLNELRKDTGEPATRLIREAIHLLDSVVRGQSVRKVPFMAAPSKLGAGVEWEPLSVAVSLRKEAVGGKPSKRRRR